MEYKDYYRTLGVEPGATFDEIKKAYRKLVRRHHPDLSKDKQAEHKTKELNEAYDVLGDPEKRAAYDRLGRGAAPGQPFAPPPDWAERYGFNDDQGHDFFSDLFAQVGRRKQFHMRGEDIHASIAVDLHDAYHGAARSVTLRVPEADASGRTALRERRISVNIPRGVLAGQQLRLSGQGQPGHGGGACGDLLLEVAFSLDARYKVDGRDVQLSVPVAPWEAALGAAIEVGTPSGRVTVSVPPGSQSGRKLRLKGRGIPAQPPGDLYLLLEVVLPPATNAKARALYEHMARELTLDLRR